MLTSALCCPPSNANYLPQLVGQCRNLWPTAQNRNHFSPSLVVIVVVVAATVVVVVIVVAVVFAATVIIVVTCVHSVVA